MTVLTYVHNSISGAGKYIYMFNFDVLHSCESNSSSFQFFSAVVHHKIDRGLGRECNIKSYK